MTDLIETVLGQTINRYRNLREEYLWFKIFSDAKFKEWVLDLIRQDQLFEQGIDGDGDVIGYYSEYTEMLNPDKVAGTPFTLFDTGDFYKSFILYIYKDAIEVDANPIKVNEKGEKENLFWKYGENIIALTEESMAKLRAEFLVRFRAELKELLHLDK